MDNKTKNRKIKVCGKTFYIKTRNRKIYLTENLKNIIERNPYLIIAMVKMRVDEDVRAFLRSKSYLVKRANKKKVRKLLDELLMSNRPSMYFKRLKNLCVIENLIPELYECNKINQNKDYHKYNVFDHCVYTADNIDKDLVLRWAALLHDVGKYKTAVIRNGKKTFYKHDVVGANTAQEILERLGYKKRFVKKVTKLVRFHMYYYQEEWSDKAIKNFMDKVGINEKNIDNVHKLPVFKLRAADRMGGGMKHTAVTEIQKKFEDRIKEVYKNYQTA